MTTGAVEGPWSKRRRANACSMRDLTILPGNDRTGSHHRRAGPRPAPGRRPGLANARAIGGRLAHARRPGARSSGDGKETRGDVGATPPRAGIRGTLRLEGDREAVRHHDREPDRGGGVDHAVLDVDGAADGRGGEVREREARRADARPPAHREEGDQDREVLEEVAGGGGRREDQAEVEGE